MPNRLDSTKYLLSVSRTWEYDEAFTIRYPDLVDKYISKWKLQSHLTEISTASNQTGSERKISFQSNIVKVDGDVNDGITVNDFAVGFGVAEGKLRKTGEYTENPSLQIDFSGKTPNHTLSALNHISNNRFVDQNCQKVGVEKLIEENLYSCTQGNYFFIQSDTPKQVTLPHIRENNFCSDTFPKSFSLSSGLKEHILNLTREKKYSCEECGKSYMQKCSLSRHTLTHNREKTYACDTCGMLFAWSSTLHQHKLTHTGKKSYSCEECGKLFGRKYSLARHTLTHTREKNYACVESGLKEHILNLTREKKKYSCEECGKSYMQKCSLSRHILTHTRKKTFACDTCGMLFAWSGALYQHKLIHTGAEELHLREMQT